MQLVDAHHHLWDLEGANHPWLCDQPRIPFRYGDYAAICRNYLAEHYLADTADHTVLGGVHVEAEWNPADPVGETRWLEETLTTLPHPVVLVVQARLEREDVDDVLSNHAAFERVRGVRQKPRAALTSDTVKRGQAGSMDDKIWRDGYSKLAQYGFSFDLQVPYWHLDQAADLACDFPETTLILNHTGLPLGRHRHDLAPWRKALEKLAQQDNTATKISGLGQTGLPWTVEANRGVIRDALAIFEHTRTMFASNFPVDRLCVDFSTLYSGFQEIVSDLPAAQQDNLFFANARKFYRIPA
jgi:predicted TIM-barrel fold metal-dependent hydrolase